MPAQQFGYHLINLVFHLINTLLVFFFIQKLTPLALARARGGFLIAFTTSLLFGIHPLHVESVAWVSERKDVLYGFFFLWALYLYAGTFSIAAQGAESKFPVFRMGVLLLLFMLSLLSKAQAVVLPVVFFAIDFLLGRKVTKKLFLKKSHSLLLHLCLGCWQ